MKSRHEMTPAELAADNRTRAAELDAEADRIAPAIAAGRATEVEIRGWLRRRAWSRKLRGQPALTAEQATAELVGLGLRL